MRQRWKIVLVDEFQDTDPVQWDVLDRAFTGHATLVLIGDPKQAIYAFRGGDVFTYLEAADTAATRRTLATNWRSDAPLVDALQVLTRGAELGDPRITVHRVEAHHRAAGWPGLPDAAPLRLRRLRPRRLRRRPRRHRPDRRAARAHRRRPGRRRRPAARLRRDLRRAEPLERRRRRDPDLQPQAGRHRSVPRSLERGIPSVVTGGGSVLLSQAADEWLTLLEALEQPHRPAGSARWR